MIDVMPSRSRSARVSTVTVRPTPAVGAGDAVAVTTTSAVTRGSGGAWVGASAGQVSPRRNDRSMAICCITHHAGRRGDTLGAYW